MKKFQKVVALVLIIFLISACEKNDVQRSRNIEESAVYSALINDQLEVPFSYLMGDPILIVNSSELEIADFRYLIGEFKPLDRDTLEDFKNANQVSQVLNMPLTVNKPYEYIVLPKDDNDWMELANTYPNAISITTLSKIGFNKKFDQALVYMAYRCGVECGSANIYFLTRKGDAWTVEGSVFVWTS